MTNTLEYQPILLFDGYCNLCNASVQFFLKHEKQPIIYFSSLQSNVGKELLTRYNIDPITTDSLVFIINSRAYTKSSAALRITKYMKGLYPMFQILLLIPKFIRDVIYDYISRNRYKWYGKSENCMVPDASIVKRFL